MTDPKHEHPSAVASDPDADAALDEGEPDDPFVFVRCSYCLVMTPICLPIPSSHTCACCESPIDVMAVQA